MTDEVASRPWLVDPDASAAVRLEHARRALLRRDPAAALIEAEELLDAQPDLPDAVRMSAIALMELQDFAPALDAWRRAAALGVTGPSAWSQAARCAFEVCELAAAADLARQAVAAAPELAEAWWLLGRCAEHTGPAAEAQRYLLQAHALSPLHFPLPHTLDRERWLEVVTEASVVLPEPVRRLIQGVEIALEELPPLDELRAASPVLTPRTAALLDPPDDAPTGTPPGTLRVFTRNLAWLERVEHMVEHLAWTIEQEAMDWLDDEDAPDGDG